MMGVDLMSVMSMNSVYTPTGPSFNNPFNENKLVLIVAIITIVVIIMNST